MVYYGNAFPKQGDGSATFGSAVASFDPDEGSVRRRKTKKRSLGKDSEREKPSIPPFERIVRLCAQRDRSQHELRTRLRKEGFDESEAEEAIERAVACGLVDDARFADAFVRGRISMGQGEARIRREMAEKHGIDLGSFQVESFDSYDDDAQVERACALLRSRPPKAKDVWSSAYRRLVTKGFTPSVAYRAVNEWIKE